MIICCTCSRDFDGPGAVLEVIDHLNSHREPWPQPALIDTKDQENAR